jgi:hypothetical protein
MTATMAEFLTIENFLTNEKDCHFGRFLKNEKRVLPRGFGPCGVPPALNFCVFNFENPSKNRI